ncbi:MAG TPA: heme-degrading domain-containing protein [Ktedonobacterales bacterium]|nr:heme-degrading domain-containing protein [Ktedonobacterales bacterium]
MDDVEQMLRRLLQQEEVLQFTEFNNETAYELGVLLVEGARREGKGVTIDINRNGQQLFHCALPGTSADNDEWIKRKNRVVNRFAHSSFYLGRYYANQGTTLEERMYLDPAEYAAHGGAFPILIKGVGVVGTITVSGLPQQEDHEFVVWTLASYLGVALPD